MRKGPALAEPFFVGAHTYGSSSPSRADFSKACHATMRALADGGVRVPKPKANTTVIYSDESLLLAVLYNLAA